MSVADPVALSSNSDNYTTQGSYDWAHYGPVPGSNQTAQYYEHKASGGSIGDLSGVNLSGVGGLPTILGYVGAGATPSISWSDGSPNTSESLTSASTGSEDYTAANIAGDGMQFTAAIPGGASETFKMYVNIYAAATYPGVKVTATLADGTPSALDTVSPPATANGEISGTTANHEYGMYEITVSNSQSGSENLNVQFTQTSVGSGASNIAIWGVTATPEPASVGLVGLAAVGLLARRRTVA